MPRSVRSARAVHFFLASLVFALPTGLLAADGRAGDEARALTAPELVGRPPVFTPDATVDEGPVTTGDPTAGPFALPGALEERSLRSEYAKVYRTPDASGKYTAVVGSAPLHFRDARGSWQDIELDFVSSGASLVVRRNRFTTEAAARFGRAPLVTLTHEGATLKLGGGVSLGVEAADGTTIAASTPAAVTGKADGRRVRYEGALDGGRADLLVGVTALALEEQLVLQAAPEGLAADTTLVWRETLALGRGLEVLVDDLPLASGTVDGTSVSILDARGEVFRLLEPFAYESDAKGDTTRGPFTVGHYRVRRTGARVVVEKRFDGAWFAAAERRWPVLVDPTVQTTVRTDNVAMHTGIVWRQSGSVGGEYHRIYSAGVGDYVNISGDRLRLYTCGAGNQMKDFLRFNIGGLHQYITSVDRLRLQLYMDYASAPSSIRFNDVALDLCAYDATAYGYTIYSSIDWGSNFLDAVLGAWIYNWHTMDLCGTAPTIVRNNRASAITYFNVGMEFSEESYCGRDVRFHDRHHGNYPRLIVDYTVQCLSSADCNDGIPCTDNVCNSGRCEYPITAGQCYISGGCYNNGYYVNQCMRCDTSWSTTSWRVMTGTACSDGNACTYSDTCQGSGACAGSAYSCNDGRSCTSDVCNGSGGCSYPLIAGNCLIAGTCYARYTPNPANSCQECRDDWGVTYQTNWGYDNTHACNDGQACTRSDYCSSGTCTGIGYTCNDGLACTSDACNGSGGCTYALIWGNCLINGACYSNGALNPGNVCQLCNINVSGSSWANAGNGTSPRQCWPCGSGSPTLGVCRYGSQTCLNGAYGACSGYACAGTESCNNVDDDCDGAVDEGLAAACSDGLACTDDGCTTGACYHNVQADKCLIGGVCYTAGQVNPSNSCQFCNPNVTRTGWSAQSTAVACGADAYACTTDRCDGAGSCIHPINTGWCLIGGVCYADNATNGACYECEPTASQTSWTWMTNKVCNDGNACSHTDKCVSVGAGCVGTAYTCNDGKTCTTDVCNGGGSCSFPLNPGFCLVSGTCYADDALNPGNDCQWCDPAISTSAFVNRPINAGCAADAYACTTDICNGTGTCTHPLNAGSCIIASTCYGSGAPNPGNPCQECNPALSTSAWSNRGSGTACPADSYACTNDVCNGAGACTHPTAAGKCLIAGTCVNDDVANPANECQWCDPAVSNAAWTNKPSGLGCTADSYSCTQDICNGSAACIHPTAANACLIAGTCYANNANNPAAECQWCQSATSQTAWVNKANGIACTADAYSCTSDLCNGSGACTHTTQAGQCLISGQCYNAGAACSPSVITTPGTCTLAPHAGTFVSNIAPIQTATTQGCAVYVDTLGGSFTAMSPDIFTHPAGGTYAAVFQFFSTGSTGNVALRLSVSNNGGASWSPCGQTPAQNWFGAAPYTLTCTSALALTSQRLSVKLELLGTPSARMYLRSFDVQLPGNCTSNGTSCRSCVPATSQTQWTYMTGQLCNDGNACTSTDTCRAGGIGCGGAAYTCDDGKACTADTCNGAGGCVFTRLAGYCIIDNTCYADDALNPANDCQWCDPSVSPTGWTNRPTGGGCKADAYSCTNDICNGAGTCVHQLIAGNCLIGSTCYANAANNPANDCQWCVAASSPNAWANKASGAACAGDSFSCTDDVCNGSGACAHPIQATKCLVGSTCYDTGAVNPANICQWCAPPRSQLAWTDRPSGTACTADAYACTDDVCDGVGTCGHPVQATKCLVGGVCYADDTTSPTNDCQWCDPTVTRTAWTNKPTGFSCADEGFSCTNDVCNGSGGCTHPIQADKCLISGTCRLNHAFKPDDGCQWCEPTKTQTAWSLAPAGSACADEGLACTNDVCNATGGCTHPIKTDQCLIAGTCFATHARNSANVCTWCEPGSSQTAWTNASSGVSCTDEGFACTDDVCNGSGTCTHPIQATKCLISNACYDDDASNTANLCQWCDPQLTKTAWSNKPSGASCPDDTKTCTYDVCNGSGTCTHPIHADKCLVTGACYLTGATSPANECQRCWPTSNQTAFTNKPGPLAAAYGGTPAPWPGAWDGTTNAYACSADALSCTSDVCDGFGTCAHVIQRTHCYLGGACVGDNTASGMCNECEPSASQLTWTWMTGKACNDSQSCTHTDKCLPDKATCGGTAYSCVDPLPCTTDVCLGDGTCRNTRDAGWCIVSSACYAFHGNNPTNACQWCDDAVAPFAWTNIPANTKSQSCYPCTSSPGIGVCRAGTQWCANGAWGACAGHQCPVAETCNGYDDNCDGTVDDNDPEGGVTCDTLEPGTACDDGRTKCRDGAKQCFPNVASFGAPETVAVPAGLMNRGNTALGGTDWKLVTSNGRYMLNLAYACSTAGNYNGWKIRKFELNAAGTSWGLVDEWSSCTPSYYVDGIVATPRYLYALEWNNATARVDRFDLVTHEVRANHGTLPQGSPYDVIAGQYDWVNNRVWLGKLQGGSGIMYWNVTGGDWTPNTTNYNGWFAAAGAASAGNVATDGTYLYLQTWAGSYGGDDWVRRYGTGLNGTTQGAFYGRAATALMASTLTTFFHSDGYYYAGGTASYTIQRARMTQARVENCDNADNNCSGTADEWCDMDDDNYCDRTLVTTGTPATCTSGGTDCADWDGARNPGRAELCDLVDNDCDGGTDEEADLGYTTCGLGECRHTVDNCVNGVTQTCNPMQGAVAEVCDNRDNDCEGTTDEEADLGYTTCGVGVCLHTVDNCVNGVTQICNPMQGSVPEVCDSLDNDCDARTDEGFSIVDWNGTTKFIGAACGTGACAGGTVVCAAGGLGAVCSTASLSRPETCEGTDQDCDGQTDEGTDPLCADAYTCTTDRCTAGRCTNTINAGTCLISATCYADHAQQPGNPCKECAAATTQTAWSNVPLDTRSQQCWPCAGGGAVNVGLCRYGTQWCANGAWGTCAGQVCPVADTCDAKDNDCDGATDEVIPDDSIACTTDLCTAGVETHPINAGWCLITGACHAQGATNPANGCQVCFPPYTNTGWSRALVDEGFESGLGSFTVADVSGSGVTWQRDGARAFSGAASLYFGQTGLRTYDKVGLAAHATATTGFVRLPNAVVNRLTFMLWLDTEEYWADPLYDVLRVYVQNEALVKTEVWNSWTKLAGTTDGIFKRVSVDLSPYAGQRVRLVFDFDSVDDNFNEYEGAYLDDVKLETACCAGSSDCDDGIACTTDSCVGGQCSYADGCSSCLPKMRNVVLNVDRTKSMSDPPVPGPGQKWPIVIQALQNVLPAYDELLNLALNVYPVGQPCNFPSALEIPFHATGPEITSYLSGINPWSEDSMAAAMGEVRAIFNGTTMGGERFAILVTDGGEWCGGDPVVVTTQLAAANVSTYVVGFGSAVDDALLRGVAVAGGRARPTPTGTTRPYYHANTLGELQAAFESILVAIAGEGCNGIDDDCDGQTDEGIANLGCNFECNVGLGGVKTCAGGSWGTCSVVPVTEKCNALDDDCDSRTDEDWPINQACTVGVGECARSGVYVCKADQSGHQCNATAGAPAPEICDNKDNDCDGSTDEAGTVAAPGILQNDLRSCELQAGVCLGSKKPAVLCVAGVWQACTATQYGAYSTNYQAAETWCDGLDNNCAGGVDEPFPLKGTACDGADDDLCKNGAYVCTADKLGLTCGVESVVNIREICSGTDDDCDGLTDAADADLLVYDLRSCELQAGICLGSKKPAALCQGGVWRPCTATQYTAYNPAYAANEATCGPSRCCDLLDNDCDSFTDEEMGTTSCGLGLCQHMVQNCVNGAPQPCDPLLGAEPEVCDGIDSTMGIDNDCDGEVNEVPDACDWMGVPGEGPPWDTWWLDQSCTDGDPWGDYALEPGQLAPCRCGYNPTYGFWDCYGY